MAGYAHLIPDEPRKGEFVPFNDEEKAVFEELERKFGNHGNNRRTISPD
jgi:hypothetical protein